MSDSRQSIVPYKEAVKQLYLEEPRGNLARHRDTLAGIMTGIVLGKSCQCRRPPARFRGKFIQTAK